MQISALLGAAGGTGQRLDVSAERGCPVGKALAATDISLKAG